jgi:phospholipase C
VQSVLPGGTNYPNDFAPILTDIESCNLPQVSWVIPDCNWSDHAAWGSAPGDGGPSWLAAIVNAVGGTNNTCGYWNNTVILVTWDD